MSRHKKKVERKPTGRPPLVEGEVAINVGFKIPEEDWSLVIKAAEKEKIGYSEVIRRALKLYLGVGK